MDSDTKPNATEPCDCRYNSVGPLCDKCTIEKLENHILFLESDIERLTATGGITDLFVVVAGREDKDPVVCGAFRHRVNAVKNQAYWETIAPKHSYSIQLVEITDPLDTNELDPTCITPTSSNAKTAPSIRDLQQMSPPEL